MCPVDGGGFNHNVILGIYTCHVLTNAGHTHLGQGGKGLRARSKSADSSRQRCEGSEMATERCTPGPARRE